MFEVSKTDEFETWVTGLKDAVGKAKILSRIRRLEMGNPGDVAPVGDGISELRILHGPGYRVYYKQTSKTIVLILCGGDKATQTKDIERAKAMAADI
jgi:putative addiction module killer protein